MPFATTAKNIMLDALTLDAIRLHSGDPGAAGTDNALGSGLSAATWNAASGGERALDADVTVTGLTPSQSVSWISIWTTSGTVFRVSAQRTSGDAAANASGEYTVKAGSTVGIADS